VSVSPFGFISARVVYDTPPDTDRIVPRRTVSLVPEDAMMFRGMPRVPDIGVEADFLIDVDGVAYGERPSLQDANDDSWASFVADEQFYNPVTGIWTPVHDSSPVVYELDGSAGNSPSLVSVQYRSKKELFIADAISFDDPTSTMVANFNQGMDDSANFTLAMALTPTSAEDDILIAFDDGGSVGINSSGLTATMDGLSWGVTIPHGPLLLAPMFLILQLVPPSGTLTAGYSPNLSYYGSSAISRGTTKFAFTLSAPMLLVALDIWGDNAPTVPEIIARYSACLGTNDSTLGAFV
jgi:hypothetical protein